VHYAAKSGAGYLSVIDPLFDIMACSRDIHHLQGLGINTIVVRDILTTASHSVCMQLLANAGIYVIFDIIRLTPSSTLQDGVEIIPTDYTTLEYIESVIDMAQEYPNTLGFQVRVDDRNFQIPLYKSYLRHAKQYIKNNNYRQIPVGYVLIRLVRNY
jgi:hypothetical protein